MCVGCLYFSEDTSIALNDYVRSGNVLLLFAISQAFRPIEAGGMKSDFRLE